MPGNFTYVADMTNGFKVRSSEPLDADHPVYALRPANPLQVQTAVLGMPPAGIEHATPGLGNLCSIH